MNVYDFVTEDRYSLIKENIEKHQDFQHDGNCKKGKQTISVHISGGHVDEWLAENIWHGNDYLVHFQANLAGGGEYMGFGNATDDLSFASSWESFKNWVDKKMKRFDGYEEEVYGQLCLF